MPPKARWLALVALVLPFSAHATQTLHWDADDTSLKTKTFDLNQEIEAAAIAFHVVTQCAADGVPDDPESPPITDVYVVPSQTLAFGETIDDGFPLLLLGNAAGTAEFVSLGRAKPRGSLAPGTYAVVFDECQDGRLDPEDAFLDPAFRIRAPWEMHGRDPTHQGRSPVRGPREPETAWTLQKDASPGTPQCCSSSHPVVGADGTLYVGSNASGLLAVRPTGTFAWQFAPEGGEIEANWIDATPALGPDGTIYVGSRQARMYAVRPDGSLRWSTQLDTAVFAGAVVDARNGALYVGTGGFRGEGSLYALSLADGSVLWRVPLSDGVAEPPALGPDGTVYLSDSTGFVRALDPAGNELWRVFTQFVTEPSSATCPGQAGRPVGISAPTFSPFGPLTGSLYVGVSYFCSGDPEKSHAHLIALDPTDGSLLWTFPNDHETAVETWTGLAVASNGTVYVGGGRRAALDAPVSWFLFGVDPTGMLLEQIPLPARVVFGAGPSLDGDDMVFVGTENGVLHAFRGGEERWRLQTLDTVISAPVLGLDGSLYFTNQNARLYALAPRDNLELRALEATQVVQTWEHDVDPLVAGKTTYVRAHLDLWGAEPRAVKGCLRGFEIDPQTDLPVGELPGSPLEPANELGSISLDPQEPVAARRGRLERTLYFRLPAAWTASGKRVFAFEAQLPERSCAALDTDPLPPEEEPDLTCSLPTGACGVFLSFAPTDPLEVRFVKLSWVDGANVTHQATDGDALTEATRLVARFPIPGLPAAVNGGRQFFIGELGFNGIPNQDNVFRGLERLRADDGCGAGCTTHYYGIFPDNYFDFGGIAYRPGKTGFGAPARSTQAHELAHNLGIAHAVHRQFGTNSDGNLLGPCGAVGTPEVEDFPYIHTLNGSPVATIGPLGEGPDRLVYGLDTAPEFGIADARVIDPFASSALMSYCRTPSWPSLTNYLSLRLRINQLDEAAAFLASATVAQDYFLVHGQVDLDTDIAEFLPFGRITTASPPPLPPPGDYRLELRDETGAVVDAISVAPQAPVQPEAPLDARVGSFLVAWPFDPTVREVVLLRDGVVLASRPASATPPDLQIEFPNGGETLTGETVALRWSASDADGDPLTYVVQFSPDDGATWETLATNWPETTLEVPLTSLTGTDLGRLRVRAQDGFHTGVDLSDGVFRVPDAPPLLVLRSPEPDRLFVGEQQVVLAADAFDREDGAIPAANLAWRSDVDGALGTGAELAVSAAALSEGDHLVTVTATDSGGMAAESSVPIRVARTVADLSLALTDAPDPLAPGDIVAYTLTVTNEGPQEATGVVGSFDPWPGWIFADLSATIPLGCHISAVIVECDVGTLSANESIGITLSFEAPTPGVFETRARVFAAETDPVPENNVQSEETTVDIDTDGDGLVDLLDNCIEAPNGPREPDPGGASQRDADGDGFGNVCDPDLDQSGLVDDADLVLLKAAFFASNAVADLSGEGNVDFLDLALTKARFGAPPGPSGVAP